MFQQRIYFFISVVEEGSFSSAAKKYYLSQSAISQQMIKLEEDIGVQLFDRSTYRPTLTDAGRYYYEECKRLLKDYDKVEIKVKQIASSSQKVLKIGITGPFENKHVPNIIAKYKECYADVNIEVKIYNFIQCIEMLEDDELDIAFGIANDFRSFQDISVLKIFEHHICVVCSENHPFAKKTSIDGKELWQEPIVSLSKNLGNHFYQDFMNAFAKDGVKPNIVKEVEDLEEIFLSIKLNEGIALLAREVVSDSENLCCLPIHNSHHQADFCVGYKKYNQKAYLPPLITQIEEYFHQLGQAKQ